MEIDFQSEIKQLLPDEGALNDDSVAQPAKTSAAATSGGASSREVEAEASDNSSVDIDVNREDSDDTDDYDSDDEASSVPNVSIRPEMDLHGLVA